VCVCVCIYIYIYIYIYIMERKSDDRMKRKERSIYENDPYAPSMFPFDAHARLPRS
jgi:hypothetical protein